MSYKIADHPWRWWWDVKVWKMSVRVRRLLYRLTGIYWSY